MIDVTWGNANQTILAWHFTGHWTFQNFVDAFRIARSLLNTVDHNVYVIADMRQSQTTESILNVARYAYRNHSEKVQGLYLVGTRPTWHSLYQIIEWHLGASSILIETVSSPERAYQAIEMLYQKV